MARYSEEHKAAILKKLLPPQNHTVAAVSAEEGIANVTLYNWLKQCRHRGVPVPGDKKTADHWSGEAKLAVVIETAPLSVGSTPLATSPSSSTASIGAMTSSP